MRKTIALYVSLTAASFAQSPPDAREAGARWNEIAKAGIAASQHDSFAEAADLFQQSWALAHTEDQRGASAYDLAGALYRVGRFREAKEWQERSYNIFRSNPTQNLNRALSVTSLADLYRMEGNYAEAERLLRETLSAVSTQPGAAPMVQVRLAELLRERGSSAESQSLFNAALRRKDIPPKSRQSALIGLADLARETGDWNSSAMHWNEVLTITRGEQDDLGEAVALRGLATLWLDSGDAARAEPLYRRSLWILEKHPEAPPEQLADALSGMGDLYRSRNKLSLAEDAWSRALQIERKTLGEKHPPVACLMQYLAEVYSTRNEFTRALDYADGATDILTGSFGIESLPAAAGFANRALVEQRASHFEAAAKDYEEALRIARVHPENPKLSAGMMTRYAELLKVMHRSREAKALTMEARSFRRK